MRLALIGYGGVGRALVRLLLHKQEELTTRGLRLQLHYILGRQGGIYSAQGLDMAQLCAQTEQGGIFPSQANVNFDFMLRQGDIDALLLATPTNKNSGEPGLSYSIAALSRGIHVITADKGPVLLAYHQLKQLAIANQACLAIGCTTGGALPAINGGLIDLAGARISSIEGVLNGTSNFILDAMRQQGLSYEAALNEAQQQGIAEADPTLDVAGWDTAIKLLILTNVLLEQHKTLADVQRQGINGLSAEQTEQAVRQGLRYRLVGRAIYERHGWQLTVRPELFGPDHPFFLAEGKNKAVRYVTDTLGELLLMGGASGVTAAAASMLRDIVNIHRGYRY